MERQVHSWSWSDIYIFIILSGILVSALAVRVAALLSYQKSLYADFLIWDEGVYQDWALKIIAGKAHAVHDFAPLPAYVMALLYKGFSPDPFVFRIFNIVLSTLACYLIYGIGKTLANRKVGLIACLLSAFYGPFIFFGFTLLKTSLATFLFSLVYPILGDRTSCMSIEKNEKHCAMLLHQTDDLGVEI